MDLVINEATQMWQIRIRKTKWMPEEHEVTTIKNRWHLAAMLKAMKTSANEFGKYCCVSNNCNTWIKKITALLNDKQRRFEFDCKPITDDFENLSTFAQKIGLELTYLKIQEPTEEETLNTNAPDTGVNLTYQELREEDTHQIQKYDESKGT